MSLKQIYTRFLASPNPAVLSPAGASLHYITTTQSVHSAEAIVKHLKRESNQLNKRVEKIISYVQADTALVLEVETEFEFVTSGGNYLPALDDNFVADQVVILPIIHIVNFENGLICQIRLHWDQSNVLKQLGVIGRTGRNWPIKEGREQCKLIATSVSGLSTPPPSPAQKNSNGRETEPSTPSSRKSSVSSSRKNSNPTRDPHASLALFAPREEDPEPMDHPAIPTRSSTKPPNRDLAEILGANDKGNAPTVAPKARSSYAPKSSFNVGGGDDGIDKTPTTTKTYAKNYDHFQLGDNDDEPAPPPKQQTSRKSEHVSSWAFEDFVTPEKKTTRIRRDDVRNFGWSEGENELDVPAVKAKGVSRKDADTHFTITDAETPEAERKKPLANVTNAGNYSRRNDGHQYEIADDSPAGSRTAKKELSDDRKAAVKMMKPQWGEYESPAQSGGGFFDKFGKEEKPTGIAIAGDGTGIRKAHGRKWGFGDDSD